jgi:hypothetical protein
MILGAFMENERCMNCICFFFLYLLVAYCTDEFNSSCQLLHNFLNK